MWTWLVVSAACLASQAASPAEDPAYTRTLEKRAADILAELKLDDPAVSDRVREQVMNQYRGLRAVYDARDATIREIPDGAAKAARVDAGRKEAEAAASTLNDRFLAGLAKDLSPEQVEVVQNKMTYHKLRVTYQGYLDMLPALTDAQKRVVYDTLKEARDRAAYAGSSEEKTEVFGRYKGRVNNYLSKQGYDLKLASKEWAERRKNAR